jgi:thiamine kinase-like enzyme
MSVDDLVRRLSAQLGALEGEPVPLEGGITNRNFRVHFGGEEYVMRLPGKDTGVLGIDRDAEHQASLEAARLGVGPEVAAYLPDAGALVTRFIRGRPLTAEELRDPTHLDAAASALANIHKGRRLATRFSPFRIVEEYRARAEDRGARVPASYDEAARVAGEIERVMQGPEHRPVPAHNDLLTSNFLWDGERMWIVDWEYAGMGNRYFDLGNMSINNDFDEGDDEWLLSSYFGEPPTNRRFATLRLMRIMSDFREAMWGVVQTVASELDFDYVAYADEHFDRLRASVNDPKFDGWMKDARGDQA